MVSADLQAAILQPVLDGIPDELREERRWTVWRSIQRPAKKKPDKIPFNARTGKPASSTGPETWASFDDVWSAYTSGDYDGLQFALGDGFAGIDLDKCRDPDSGDLAPWATTIVERFPTCWEVSPSGTGLKCILRGTLPPDGRRKQVDGGEVEMYDAGRLFTVTGHHVEQTPFLVGHCEDELRVFHAELFPPRSNGQMKLRRVDTGAGSDEEIIRRAMGGTNGAKFSLLWAGDISGHDDDHSRADLALCSTLAFWRGPDPAGIDALFRQSGLMREKWNREDYRSRTIEQAICGVKEFFDWSRNGHSVNSVSSVTREPSGDKPQPWEPPVPFAELSVPEFPVHTLPAPLARWVDAEARATQTPPDLAAAIVFGVCAAAVAKRVEIRVNDEHWEPANLWCLVAQPPGSRKSAVVSAAVAPIHEFEQSELKRLGPRIAEAQTEYKILEKRLSHLTDKASKANGLEREDLEREAQTLSRKIADTLVPCAPQLIIDDCSPERCATLLRDNGGRLAVFTAEGDLVDIMAGRYSRDPNFGVFLRGHAGDALRVNRVNRPSEFVDKPALTMGMAVQGDVLRGLVGNPGFRGRGMVGRFLYFLPRPLIGMRQINPPSVPPEVKADYRQLVMRLLTLPEQTGEDGQPVPYDLHFAPDASEELTRFAEMVEPRLREFGDLGQMTDWGGKLVGAVARIAGVLSMAQHAERDDPWREPIHLETVQCAIEIGHYLIGHAKAAYCQMGANESVEDAKYVLRWIQEHGVGSFSKRAAHRGMQGKFKKAEDLDAPLRLLEDHGYVREARQIGEQTGRKKSPKFDVNHLMTELTELTERGGRDA